MLEPKDDYDKLMQVAKICFAYFILTLILCIYVYNWHPGAIGITADILGVVGAILSAIQYFPQIYTTLHLQHAGSLSIPMMCMQTPGGFAWSASLALREGTKWSSWLPYFTAAFLQAVLLAIAVYFELRNRKRAKEAQEIIEESLETSPLLGS